MSYLHHSITIYYGAIKKLKAYSSDNTSIMAHLIASLFIESGYIEWVKTLQNEETVRLTMSLLLLCGEINQVAFEATISSDCLQQNFHLEGEDISAFQAIVRDFRNKYAEHSLFTEMDEHGDPVYSQRMV